jgi:hypothetical protein
VVQTAKSIFRQGRLVCQGKTTFLLACLPRQNYFPVGMFAKANNFPVGLFAKANNFPVGLFAKANKVGAHFQGSFRHTRALKNDGAKTPCNTFIR